MNLYKSILPVDEKGFYGEFGGSFVPPELQKNIDELQEAYLRYVDDPEFQKEFNDLLRDKHWCRIFRKGAEQSKEGTDDRRNLLEGH